MTGRRGKSKGGPVSKMARGGGRPASPSASHPAPEKTLASDRADLPLGGVAVYNPHLLSKQEVVSVFFARRDLLERLVESLRRTAAGSPGPHHLVLGQRGMGKTLLLHRLAYAVEDDPELAGRWLALTFPEEQYNVAGLADFWLNCADALGDRLEGLGRQVEAEALDREIDRLRGGAGDERAERALALLVDAAGRFERRLLLLVDNADLVFERIGSDETQEWALREALSSRPELAFVGASAAAVEATYDHGRAFYDFFQVHELRGLTLEETQGLLRHYARTWENLEVETIVDHDPGRLRTLHALTGGNPRTLVLLYQIFARGLEGDVRTDLEQLLDHCTPLYKARFEALAPQAQQVVHALALHWDPVSAGELAAAMGLEVNLVSAQLNRLVKQGTVEKVPYDPPTKTGFQIAERFFNIWYLMRASRRVRKRLIWLVEFLKMFYSQDDLLALAVRHLKQLGLQAERERLRDAEMGFALAQTVREGPVRGALEEASLRLILRATELRERLGELLDLEGEDIRLRDRAELVTRMEALRAKRLEVAAKTGMHSDWLDEFLWDPAVELRLKEEIFAFLEGRPEGDFSTELAEDFESSAARVSAVLADWFGAGFAILRRSLQFGEMVTYDDLAGAALVEVSSATPGFLLKVLQLGCFADVALALTREASTALDQSESRFARFFEIRGLEGIEARPVAAASLTQLLLTSGNEHDVSSILAKLPLSEDRRMGGEYLIGWDLACLFFMRSVEARRDLAVKLLSIHRLLETQPLAVLRCGLLLDAERMAEAALELRALVTTAAPRLAQAGVQYLLPRFARIGELGVLSGLLKELGLDELWRPLWEAIQAMRKLDPGYLDRLAPEVRQAAEVIFEDSGAFAQN